MKNILVPVKKSHAKDLFPHITESVTSTILEFPKKTGHLLKDRMS
jgi:hypothetical protein